MSIESDCIAFRQFRLKNCKDSIERAMIESGRRLTDEIDRLNQQLHEMEEKAFRAGYCNALNIKDDTEQ